MFLGCVIPARLPFIEKSAQLVFETLNLEVHNLENASCCPDPSGIPAVDQKAWLTLGARNLSLVDKDTEIISLCAGCIETLKIVNHTLSHDAKKLEEINHNLAKIDRKFEGNAHLKHAGQLLYENMALIKEKVVKPLTGLKVAVHYGCHFLRPSEILEWDDPFEAITVDEIIETLGAEAIQYSSKMECCGYPLLKTDKDISYKLLYQKLAGIKKAGANCIAVVCPSCYMHLDYQQKAVNKLYNTDFKFPVLYLTELIALAFGKNEKELGLKFHGIKPKKLLQETGIITAP
jgi:heterodisulfide reductase subunit B